MVKCRINVETPCQTNHKAPYLSVVTQPAGTPAACFSVSVICDPFQFFEFVSYFWLPISDFSVVLPTVGLCCQNGSRLKYRPKAMPSRLMHE
jgi:hypothetical protein